MSKKKTTKKLSKSRTKPAHVRRQNAGHEPVRKVYEVRTGHALEFDGFIVVEMIEGVERILGWAQSSGCTGPYDDDAAEKKDYDQLLRVATRMAANPALIGRSQWMLDYRKYGMPDSLRRMPDEPYEWVVYDPGTAFKENGRYIFPFCPFRLQEMLESCTNLIAHLGGVPPEVADNVLRLSDKILHCYCNSRFPKTKK